MGWCSHISIAAATATDGSSASEPARFTAQRRTGDRSSNHRYTRRYHIGLDAQPPSQSETDGSTTGKIHAKTRDGATERATVGSMR